MPLTVSRTLLPELGPMPADLTEQQEWDKRKKELESEVDLQLAETRLSVDGLEESWDQWQEREKLKKLREQLLQGQASPGGLVGLQPTQQQPTPMQQPQHVQHVHAEHSPGDYPLPRSPLSM